MARQITFEAMGALPNFRYDIVQPLLQQRVTMPELALIRPALEAARLFDDPRFRNERTSASWT